MLFDDNFHIVHTKVTYFQRILVEDFVVFVSDWEVLSDEAEVFSGDVRFDVQAVRGVEPNDISVSVFLSLRGVLHGSYFIS